MNTKLFIVSLTGEEKIVFPNEVILYLFNLNAYMVSFESTDSFLTINFQEG